MIKTAVFTKPTSIDGDNICLDRLEINQGSTGTAADLSQCDVSNLAIRSTTRDKPNKKMEKKRAAKAAMASLKETGFIKAYVCIGCGLCGRWGVIRSHRQQEHEDTKPERKKFGPYWVKSDCLGRCLGAEERSVLVPSSGLGYKIMQVSSQSVESSGSEDSASQITASWIHAAVDRYRERAKTAAASRVNRGAKNGEWVSGVVRKWKEEKGFGFISTGHSGDEGSVFVHRCDLKGCVALQDEDKVEFQLSWNEERQKYSAKHVTKCRKEINPKKQQSHGIVAPSQMADKSHYWKNSKDSHSWRGQWSWSANWQDYENCRWREEKGDWEQKNDWKIASIGGQKYRSAAGANS